MKAVIVSTGRAGTRSISKFLKEGYSQDVRDHSDHEPLMNALSLKLMNENQDAISGEIVDILKKWTHFIEICHLGGLILPEFLEAFGPELKIIHLIRQDQNMCIQSLIGNSKYNPDVWGNYLDSNVSFRMNRPAAFLYGEMSINNWHKLDLFDKVLWLVSKHKNEVENKSKLFRKSMTTFTEDLNNSKSQKKITDFIEPIKKIKSKMPWLNNMGPPSWQQDQNSSYQKGSHQDLQNFIEEFTFFDWNKAVENKFYPLEHFINSALLRLEQQPQHHELRKILSDHNKNITKTLKLKH